MPNSLHTAALKRELETRLAARAPRALTPVAVQPPRLLSLRIPALEDLLGGGLPIGGISECIGPASSGLTSIACSVLQEATANAACAYIDPANSFDPASAAAAGVVLQNLLWVRFAIAADAHLQEQNRVTSKPTPGARMPITGRSSSYHPRTETRGLDRALESMLVQKAEARLKKAEGTPGFPNQKLSLEKLDLLSVPEDQVAYEQIYARRPDHSNPLRQMDRQAAESARKRARVAPASKNSSPRKNSSPLREDPWAKLDQAIRATDQVLQAGGFRVVVLDLAGIPAEQSIRIPAATWFRFRRAAQVSDAVLLLLTRQPCARSSASCVVACSPHIADQKSRIFSTLQHTAEVVRQRTADVYAKKAPGRVAGWEATAHCMRAVGK